VTAVEVNWLLEEPDAHGTTAVLPRKTIHKHQRDHVSNAGKWRHLAENYFAKIKKLRGLATRCDDHRAPCTTCPSNRVPVGRRVASAAGSSASGAVSSTIRSAE